jgi:hypothetical protein
MIISCVWHLFECVEIAADIAALGSTECRMLFDGDDRRRSSIESGAVGRRRRSSTESGVVDDRPPNQAVLAVVDGRQQVVQATSVSRVCQRL